MQYLNYVKQSMIHFMVCFTMQVKISFERSVDYKNSKDLLTSINLQRMFCIATWCEKVFFVNIISLSWLNQKFNLVVLFFFQILYHTVSNNVSGNCMNLLLSFKALKTSLSPMLVKVKDTVSLSTLLNSASSFLLNV